MFWYILFLKHSLPFFGFCMINIGIVGRLCVICVQAINKLSLRYIFYDNVKLMLLMLFDEVNCWNVLFFASILYIRTRRLIIFLPWHSTSSYLSYAQQPSTRCDMVGYISSFSSADYNHKICITVIGNMVETCIAYVTRKFPSKIVDDFIQQ